MRRGQEDHDWHGGKAPGRAWPLQVRLAVPSARHWNVALGAIVAPEMTLCRFARWLRVMQLGKA